MHHRLLELSDSGIYILYHLDKGSGGGWRIVFGFPYVSRIIFIMSSRRNIEEHRSRQDGTLTAQTG